MNLKTVQDNLCINSVWNELESKKGAAKKEKIKILENRKKNSYATCVQFNAFLL